MLLACRQMEPIIQAAIVGGSIVCAAHALGNRVENGLKSIGMDTFGTRSKHVRNQEPPVVVPAQVKDGQAPKPR